MNGLSEKNFGALIAFLVPGFLFLWALSLWLPQFGLLLATSAAGSPSVGGFFYATLASLSVGLVLSAVRWLIVDHVMHCTGLSAPNLDFGELADSNKFAAFEGLVLNHYRFYQYYSGVLVVLVVVLIIGLSIDNTKLPLWAWICLVLLSVCLFFGARDSLKKYYDRSSDLIGRKTTSKEQNGD